MTNCFKVMAIWANSEHRSLVRGAHPTQLFSAYGAPYNGLFKIKYRHPFDLAHPEESAITHSSH